MLIHLKTYLSKYISESQRLPSDVLWKDIGLPNWLIRILTSVFEFESRVTAVMCDSCNSCKKDVKPFFSLSQMKGTCVFISLYCLISMCLQQSAGNLVATVLFCTKEFVETCRDVCHCSDTFINYYSEVNGRSLGFLFWPGQLPQTSFIFPCDYWYSYLSIMQGRLGSCKLDIYSCGVWKIISLPSARHLKYPMNVIKHHGLSS